MTNPISTVIPEVKIAHGQAVTTSIAIANFFGKQHRDVTKKIRSLECSPAFTSANFCAVAIKAQAGFDSREIEAYEITKNGFIFLVMGFTGKKAAAFKEAYIAEFDRMETELHNPSRPKAPRVTAEVIYYENGIPACRRPLHPDEIIITKESNLQMLACAGYVVVNHDRLMSMRMEEVMNLCDSIRREHERWLRGG